MRIIAGFVTMILPFLLPMVVQFLVLDRTKKIFLRCLPLILLEIFPLFQIWLGKNSGTPMGADNAVFYEIVAVEVLIGCFLGWLLWLAETWSEK